MLNLPKWPDRSGQIPMIVPVGTENGWPYPEPLRGDLVAGTDVWREVDEEVYFNQLEAVPPKRMDGGQFLVGECYSHEPHDDGSVDEYYTAFIRLTLNGKQRHFCRHVPLHCWTSEINRLQETIRRERYLLKPMVHLNCACCDGLTRGRQWHNQDDGYGLCPKCGDKIQTRETPEYVRQTYGIRGIHWGFEPQA